MKRTTSLVLAIVLLTTALNPVAFGAQADADEAAIRHLVERFFDAFQKKDIESVMACWSVSSPMFADVKQFAQNDFAASEEIQLVNVAFTQWKIEANQAFVRLRFVRKWRNVSTNQPAQLTTIWDAQFLKEGNDWKFWRQSSAISALAASLGTAKTKNERAELLKTEKELVTAGLVQTFSKAAVMQATQGKFNEALRQNDIACEVAAVLGELKAQAYCYSSRGDILSSQKNPLEALTNYQRALHLFQDAKDKWWEAETLNGIGNIYHSIGKYTEALTQFDASLKIKREIEDRAGEARTLNNTGGVYQSIGKYAEALAQFDASLKIAREIGDSAVEAITLNGIGSIYESTGRYADALRQLYASLKIMREIGDRAGEGHILNSIGIIYKATGKYAEALTQFDASLSIMRDIGDRQGEANVLGGLGNIYKSTGRYAEALAQFDASARIMREIGNRAGEAKALGSLGNVYVSTGKYTDALAQFEASLKILREIGDRAGEAKARNNIGVVYQSTGKYADALSQFDVSSKITREIGDRESEAISLGNIAVVYRIQKQWQQAVDYYRKAIPLIELTRTQAQESSLQTGFFAQHTSLYYGLVESLLAFRSDRDEIFAVSEQAKARTLVELMSGGKVNILKSMTDAERQREQELKANFIAASAQLNAAYSGSTPDQRRSDELKQQMNKARDDYTEFRVEMFIAHPELQSQRASYDSLSLAQLSEPLFAKDPDLCLLSYLVSNDKTFLLVITSGKGTGAPVKLTVHTLRTNKNRELTADELKKALNTFRLRYTNESAPYKQLGRDLYEMLLAPAEGDLKGRSHVVIIPDGMLYSLPFQALIDKQGKYFIERHKVSYAPSVTALTQMMKLADKKRKSNANTLPLFAMGRRTFPDQAQYRNLELLKAEEQVRSIARLFGVAALTGNEATKSKAIAGMGEARYVHFATHGELNEVAPMESAIVLGKGASDDGMLYARELVDMDLQAELVVLSACDTGLGQQVNGEGILGLTWALFVAGTPTSVVTQWKVRDDSMNRLMLEFYRQIRLSSVNGRSVISKAEALRRAQLSLMKDDVYKHPYHWAPVALVGDWR